MSVKTIKPGHTVTTIYRAEYEYMGGQLNALAFWNWDHKTFDTPEEATARMNELLDGLAGSRFYTGKFRVVKIMTTVETEVLALTEMAPDAASA